MNYGYNPNFTNPYARYGMPSYNQPQYQPQPQQTMPQQQPQPQVVYEIPIQNVGYATLKEAEAFIVFPNSKALFIDKEKGMSYLKTANGDGVSSIRYFKQVEVNADGTPLQPQEASPQVDMSDFLKKDALKGYATVEQVNAVLTQIEQIRKQIMGGRANASKQQP